LGESAPEPRTLPIKVPQKILVPPTTIGVLRKIILEEDGTLHLIDVFGINRLTVRLHEPSKRRS